MVINIKKSVQCFEMCTIFAAVILSMNGIRYMLNVQESNIVMYLIYIIIIPVFFIENGYTYNMKIKKRYVLPCLFLIAMLLMGVVTGIFNGNNALFSSIKLILLVLDAWVISCFTKEQIRKTINYLYAIIFLYVLLLIVNPSKIDIYLSAGSNYLVLTLPLGLVCTMISTRIVFAIYNRYQLKQIIFECIFALLLFFSLTKFTARSSMLFPILVLAIILLILGRKHIFKLLVLLFVFGALFWVGYNYFIQNANPYIVNRMLSLFNNNKSEDRWKIWEECIQCMYKNRWFLIGGGISAFEIHTGFYPHNLYLQCIGEFGIFGIVNCVYFTYRCIRNGFWIIKTASLINNDDKMLACEIGAGLLYLFFTFMKSFQLYDAGIFFIFIAIFLTLIRQLKSKKLV